MAGLKPIKIPFDTRALYKTFGAGILLIGTCSFLLFITRDQIYSIQGCIVIFIGIVSMLYFGGLMFFMVRTVYRCTYGLIIDEGGIHDNSNIASAGSIPWEDIREIRVESLENSQSLFIYLKNPQEYIESQKSWFPRVFMKLNMSTFGTPIVISSRLLDTTLVDMGEIPQLIDNFFMNNS